MNVRTETHDMPHVPKRRRFRLALAGTTAAVLVSGGGVAWGTTTSHQASPSPVVLTGTASGGARCAAPTVAGLRHDATTAFEGTVTSVRGDQVTFHVDHWYRGGGASTVRIKNVKGSEPDLTYAVGGHWLVPARKGVVLACSVVGADPTMRRLFQRAFAQATTPPRSVPATPPGA
ncbi:hypothetical protein ACWEO4_11670 [Streptomyces sp. NPDC004393]|uniref:hypothetical protein n=1 Tax=Streptomyces sp. NPDC004533 TaxID=3154278 RepID=UPI0033B6CF2F